MNCDGCGRQRLWRLLKLLGETTKMSVSIVSRYKYSQERYRLSHRAPYNVGINDPCMVKEFSNLDRHSMLVPVAMTAVCHGPTSCARVRGGVAATVWCRVLLETTAVSGLVDN